MTRMCSCRSTGADGGYGRRFRGADGGDGGRHSAGLDPAQRYPLELITSEHSGWLVPENNALALAITGCVQFISIARRLIPVLQNARQKVEAEFNQQVINRQLASPLQTL